MGAWSLKQEDHKLETCLGCVGKHLLETKLEEKGLSLSACEWPRPAVSSALTWFLPGCPIVLKLQELSCHFPCPGSH